MIAIVEQIFKNTTPKQNEFRVHKYAGARFCNSPAPNSLPQPPRHWVTSTKNVDLLSNQNFKNSISK